MNISSLFSLLRGTRRQASSCPYPVVLPAAGGVSRGRVLFSYIPESLTLKRDDPRFGGHPNYWKARTIAEIFSECGFDVDAIRWYDWNFRPRRQYEVIFDISSNLPRLASFMDVRPVLLLHRTGADAFFQNASEIRRARAMEDRRGVAYCPKRIVPFPDLERMALERADAATLIGNEWTRDTYPVELRNKLDLVPVSAADVRGVAKRSHYVPPERHFLCFCGSGAVHKGVDLLLEVFGGHPVLTLHIVGDADTEPDFRRAYLRELSASNIHCHGFLHASDPRFKAVIDTCFAFVLPTCSEGISAAVATSMQMGLYPIISRESGVTLPSGRGRYLEACTVEEIEGTVMDVFRRSGDDLEEEIAAVQTYAAAVFSREAFRSAMAKAIKVATERR